MWLRLKCWWYDICYKHGEAKRECFLGSRCTRYLVCDSCESDRTYHRQRVTRNIIQEVRQGKLEFK